MPPSEDEGKLMLTFELHASILEVTTQRGTGDGDQDRTAAAKIPSRRKFRTAAKASAAFRPESVLTSRFLDRDDTSASSTAPDSFLTLQVVESWRALPFLSLPVPFTLMRLILQTLSKLVKFLLDFLGESDVFRQKLYRPV